MSLYARTMAQKTMKKTVIKKNVKNTRMMSRAKRMIYVTWSQDQYRVELNHKIIVISTQAMKKVHRPASCKFQAVVLTILNLGEAKSSMEMK